MQPAGQVKDQMAERDAEGHLVQTRLLDASRHAEELVPGRVARADRGSSRTTFNQDVDSLEVMVNDILLFDESEDLTEDPKKKMQVMEKLNKFIFLASEELKKVEKEIKEKEEEEKERRKLQEIFRNF